MKSRMTLTSKRQLVLCFLLFTLTVPLIGVHDLAEGSWQSLTIVISYESSYIWKGIEKAKNVSWLFHRKDGSSLSGISLNLGSWYHSFGEL